MNNSKLDRPSCFWLVEAVWEDERVLRKRSFEDGVSISARSGFKVPKDTLRKETFMPVGSKTSVTLVIEVVTCLEDYNDSINNQENCAI